MRQAADNPLALVSGTKRISSKEIPQSRGPRDAMATICYLLTTDYYLLSLAAMMTVFENASPMLSDVTSGTSATAMWTMRRS